MPYRHFCRSGTNQKPSTQKWNVERTEELDVFRPTDSGLHPGQAFSLLSWQQSGKILSLPQFLSTSSSYAWASQCYSFTRDERDSGKPVESKVRGETDGVPKYNVLPPSDRFIHVLSCVIANSPPPSSRERVVAPFSIHDEVSILWNRVPVNLHYSITFYNNCMI